MSKFKIGDKVTLRRDVWIYTAIKVGEHLVVSGFHELDDDYVSLRRLNGESVYGGHPVYRADDFVLVEKPSVKEEAPASANEVAINYLLDEAQAILEQVASPVDEAPASEESASKALFIFIDDMLRDVYGVEIKATITLETVPLAA